MMRTTSGLAEMQSDIRIESKSILYRLSKEYSVNALPQSAWKHFPRQLN